MARAFPGLAVLACVLCSLLSAAAAQTDEQRATTGQLRAKVRRAGELFRQRRFGQSGVLVREVQEEMDRLAATGDEKVIQLLAPVHESLKRAHALLELEGVKLPALKDPTRTPAPGADAAADGRVSFVNEIGPLLSGKCGRCHIRAQRGMLSLASYAALMRGANDGAVVLARNAPGSRIVEVIESGDMPRGGQKVSAAELQKLKDWINQGAAHDGDNPDQPLASGDAASTQTALEPKLAPGNETVSFAEDLAPLLAEQCAGCHGNGQRAAANFDLSTFQAMLRGGDSGPPLQPGAAAESLLIQKLKGVAEGQRMPRGREPWSDEVVQRFATWINEGAAFDGTDLRQNVTAIAAVAVAAAATHEQLGQNRRKRALEQWGLSVTGVAPEILETDQFLLVGDLGRQTLQDVAAKAERIAPRVAELLVGKASGPLVKGRITLFLFQRRYDYAEFGKMVENRDLPPGQRAHGKYDVVDAYAALAAPEEDHEVAVLAEQIAAVYLTSQGAPLWFAQGGGRWAASRIAADDPQVKQWQEQLPAALRQMKKPDDAIEGRIAPEWAALANYSLVQFLYKDSKRIHQVLESTAQGQDFYQSFSAVFKAGPAQAADIWIRTISRK